jgi:hypothetical protein
MTDWFHNAVKVVFSYNRTTTLLTIIGVSLLIAFAGCEIKTLSPFTGEQATDEQIVAQAEDYKASVALTEKEAFAAYEAVVARLKAEAEQKGRAVEQALADTASKRENIGAIFGIINDIGESIGGPAGSSITLGVGLLGSLFGLGTMIDAARRKVLINSIVNAPATKPTTPAA